MANRRQSTEIVHGSVRSATFTIERPRGVLAARLLIFPGLVGTERSYAGTSSFIASKLPIEVVTMTHGRERGRLRAPMKARSAGCLAVARATSTQDLPNYVIGHSLGGADAIHMAEYPKGRVVAGIGLETPVGMTDTRPKINDVMGSLWDNIRRLPYEFKVDSTKYAMSNPALAAAEAIHAKRSEIRQSAQSLGDLILLEAYNSGDVVVKPPVQAGSHIVREGLSHIAICLEPEVGLEHAAVFLDHAEALARQQAV